MRAHLIIIFQVRQQHMSEVPLSEHNNVVKAFPSDRTDQPFGISILPRGEKQLVAGGEGRSDRNQSAAGKDRGERPRSAKSVGRPAGDDAPDRRHPDGRTGEQAKILDREVIRRRDARAERSRGEPHQEAPEKADGRYPKLFNLVAPHQCLLRWTIWSSVASKKRKRA